ncbi:hypothetical protein [Parafilimonas sp.]|uniref:hypothetical protein n=1 Tax=Parafilimonas sp. TaxID=1969739 RepID=UPI0039E43E52
MKLNKLINPFAYFSEKKLLLTGLIFFLLAGAVSYLSGVANTGVFKINWVKISLPENYGVLATDIICPAVLLFVTGKFINNKTRFIDVLSTTLVARIPCYFCIVLSGMSFMKNLNSLIKANQEMALANTKAMLMFSLLGFVILLFLVWSVIWFVNGFKTSVHASKWQHYVLFAIALIFSDIFSRLINYHLFK